MKEKLRAERAKAGKPVRAYTYRVCDPATCKKKHLHYTARCKPDCTKDHGHCYEDCTRTIHDHNVAGGGDGNALRPTENVPMSRRRNSLAESATKRMKRQDITQQRATIATLEAQNKTQKVDGQKADNILRELFRQDPHAFERVDLDKAAEEVAAEHTGKREASKEAAYKELQTELELAKHSHREVCKRYDEVHAVMQQFGITSADQLRQRLASTGQ